ncbi:MAG: TonB-dependent receptor [Flavobacteriales bacterium]|nr:TonB-dependent receptor [Flavobacteriales bacterium]
MKTLTTTLLAFLLSVTTLLAQVGEIRGTVKDKKTGETIPGVTVYIEVGGVQQGTATDMDGKFVLKPVKSGVHTVWFSYMGYKKMKIYDVGVTTDKITFVNPDMIEEATLLGSYDVVEQMHTIPLIEPDQPGIQHVTSKEIMNSPNKQDPIKIVATLPGIILAPNGKDVYVRGSRPQSTQFFTDGMKSLTGDIGIPGQAIGSMKVYTGGVPARYGDITGGVIVVETKSYFDLAQQYK